MYFESLNHKGLFEQLITEYADGQKNERTSSLYVFTSLPVRFIEEFRKKPYIDFYAILESELYRSASHIERAKVKLSCTLYHGSAKEVTEEVDESNHLTTVTIKETNINEYTGALNHMTPILAQALVFNSELTKEMNSIYEEEDYFYQN